MSLVTPAARLSSALAMILLGAGLSGCGGGGTSGGGAKPPASETILIGHFGSMTGSEATFGQSTDNGIRLAIKEVNAAGGVLGKTIELKTYDDQGKGQEAGTAVTRLITSDKVVAVLGEVASSLSIAGGRVAQQYGVPMISPSSTNPQVTEIGDMVFRVCFLDPFQGWVAAKFARGQGLLHHFGHIRKSALIDCALDRSVQSGISQSGVSHLPGTGRGRLPGVVTGAGHVERRAQRGEGVFGFHGFDPLVACFDGSVKMPSVFFSMSRCSRTRASSALRARFSASRSSRCGVASPQ